MIKFYKLIGKIAVPCDSALEWASAMMLPRHVADEEVMGIRISTVFLGLDHRFLGKGDPLLFETMVFMPNGETSNMRRYFTWEEAEQGHKELADLVRAEVIEANYDAIELIGKLRQKVS
jgi:hypothetical protein